MHIELPHAHLNFFHKHQFLELEEFLTPEQVAEYRIKTFADFDDAYLNGRDLWRKSETTKKLVCNRDLASCAAKLTETPSLVLAFDQALATYESSTLELAEQPVTLQDISNVSHLACGVMINLSNTTLEPSENPFPDTPGGVVFIAPDLELDFKKIAASPTLLIAYANVKPLYIQNKLDPHAHALKSLDYAFGDHLKINTHPLLIK